MLQPSVQIASPHTAELFHEFIPATQPGGVPALLLHGFTVRGDMFNPVQEALSERHTLLIPDLRGGGRSAHLTGSATLQDHVSDLYQLLDKYQLQQVHLVGYSMGGIVAQAFLFRHPDRVRSLTLSNTWAYKQGSLLEWSQVYTIPAAIQTIGSKKLGRMLTPNVMRDFYGFYDPGVYEWYHHVYGSYTDERLLEAAHEIFRFDSRRKLPKLRIPTLVIGGSEDKVVPPYHSRELAKLILQARLEILAGGGHGQIFTHNTQIARLLLNHWATVEGVD